MKFRKLLQRVVVATGIAAGSTAALAGEAEVCASLVPPLERLQNDVAAFTASAVAALPDNLEGCRALTCKRRSRS